MGEASSTEHEGWGHGIRAVALAGLRCSHYSSAQPAHYGMGRNGKEDTQYTQPTIAGLADLEQAENQFANCLILSLPVYKDTGKKQEWIVTVHAQPSIFQPDADIELIASAHNDLAKRSQRMFRSCCVYLKEPVTSGSVEDQSSCILSTGMREDHFPAGLTKRKDESCFFYLKVWAMSCKRASSGWSCLW